MPGVSGDPHAGEVPEAEAQGYGGGGVSEGTERRVRETEACMNVSAYLVSVINGDNFVLCHGTDLSSGWPPC